MIISTTTLSTSNKNVTQIISSCTYIIRQSISVGDNSEKENTHGVSTISPCCVCLPSEINHDNCNKKHHFKSWPGLTPQIISKHLPLPVATVQGHLHQERQNLQSTKVAVKNPNMAAILKHYNALKVKKKTRSIVRGCFASRAQRRQFPCFTNSKHQNQRCCIHGY